VTLWHAGTKNGRRALLAPASCDAMECFCFLVSCFCFLYVRAFYCALYLFFPVIQVEQTANSCCTSVRHQRQRQQHQRQRQAAPATAPPATASDSGGWQRQPQWLLQWQRQRQRTQ
jgi:hypothetical protein